jgi:hypothetical protein
VLAFLVLLLAAAVAVRRRLIKVLHQAAVAVQVMAQVPEQLVQVSMVLQQQALLVQAVAVVLFTAAQAAQAQMVS